MFEVLGIGWENKQLSLDRYRGGVQQFRTYADCGFRLSLRF